MIPRATIRLQLHAGFDFDAAGGVAEYCAALGVSHLYLSPVTQAKPGSPHGYDVIDCQRVSADLGGEAGLLRLAERAGRHGLGIIADIVPNHMAADPRNTWWRDVLARGRASPHAATFDIDWEAGGGRLLLPILAQPYDEALRDGAICLSHDGNEVVVRAGGQSLPIADACDVRPLDFDARCDADHARLHALLERQHYRLACWRAATSQLNWRRFFEVNELVGVRVEEPAVFEATHALVIDLYARGVLDGVRVDHIDGLAAPGEYLRRLREALLRAAPGREPYIIVEKILGPEERLDPRWPIHGTTGYDFMDDAAALLHARSAREPLEEVWWGCGGEAADPANQLCEVRRDTLKRRLISERRALVAAWGKVAANQPRARDWDEEALGRILDAWLVGFPVYRCYAEDGGASTQDRRNWMVAAHAAGRQLSPAERERLALWLSWLDNPSGDAVAAVRRLQQTTPPLAAKSLEDTFFYRYGLLLSRNEVGSSPARFSLEADEFHRRAHARAVHLPHAMLCTATHDHKRGEDARARLAVLTEMPVRWGGRARRWLDTLPRNELTQTDRYMLLQTLVGAWPATWPLNIREIEAEAVRGWLDRVLGWQTKALREADIHTSWANPESVYEGAAKRCLDALDPEAADPRPLDELARLAAPLVAPGQINSLAQTLLRNTAPGVPDLYQCAQTWDQSLVDPDNRRAVDWEALRALLAAPAPLHPTAAQWRSGRVKQYLIQACLRSRAELPIAFDSDYVPLRLRGRRAANALAYLRGTGRQIALIIIPRLCALQLGEYARGGAAVARDYWKDTSVMLPAGVGSWADRLSLREIPVASNGHLSLFEALKDWPVAFCTATG